jgi:hypothetical protein
MLKYLVPKIALADLPAMIGVALFGALFAGGYGVVHDQITYTISPEYFTNLKFNHFRYANFGLGDRVFAGAIGFLAAWWVGFIVAWFLGRRFLPNQSRAEAHRRLRTAFVCVFVCGASAGVLGYAYGLWRGPDADYAAWIPVLREYAITDGWAFIRVAYIHNASYLGGFLGLIVSLLVIRPAQPPADEAANLSVHDSHGHTPV